MAEKSNEITAIPELLEALLLKGCLVIIDAMGCQKAIAAQIIRQESDYAPLVKNNSPAWPRPSKACSTPPSGSATRVCRPPGPTWIDKDHGRIETRRSTVIDDLSGVMDRLKSWSDVKTLILVECTGECDGVTSPERRYYLCSQLADAAYLGNVVRGHWGVEYNLHWSPDVVFGEDQARMRRGNAAENFSVLRRIALNVTRQEKTLKAGVKNRRLVAASDDTYRLKLLTSQALA